MIEHQPIDVTNVEIVFAKNVDHLIPNMDDIPEEFKDDEHPWVLVAKKWEERGLPLKTKFLVKEGLDANKVTNHIFAVRNCWGMHPGKKMVCLAYIMYQWLEDLVDDDFRSLINEKIVYEKPDPSRIIVNRTELKKTIKRKNFPVSAPSGSNIKTEDWPQPPVPDQ